MSGDDVQVTGDLSDVLHDVGTKFRQAFDGLPAQIRAEGIDPSTHSALGDSHDATQKLLDRGAKVSDNGRKFTEEAEEQAHESGDDIKKVDTTKTELSSGHAPPAQPQAMSTPPPSAAQQQPMNAAPPQQTAMPAGMSGGGSGSGSGRGGGGGGFPNFAAGAQSAGNSQSDSGAKGAGRTHPRGPSVFMNFDAQQMQNAKEIVNAGLRLGMSRDAIQIALMTAITESGIRRLANANVADSLLIDNDGIGEDHDSTGPFQQRQSWGATADLMDPTTSAGKFFAELVKVDGWEYMDKGQAAQKVQKSAFPDAYDKYEEQAGQLLDRIFAG